MRTDKLYLVGFMGAGKSTVARALGRRLGWRIEDIDAGIETRERRSISSIFSQEGEAYFRQVEKAVLTALLPLREAVVATGGGTFAEADNRAVMLADGAVAWLDVPFEKIVDRIPVDGRRPLAADRASLQRLFSQRELAYRQAHTRVDAARPVDEVVERLLAWIGY